MAEWHDDGLSVGKPRLNRLDSGIHTQEIAISPGAAGDRGGQSINPAFRCESSTADCKRSRAVAQEYGDHGHNIPRASGLHCTDKSPVAALHSRANLQESLLRPGQPGSPDVSAARRRCMMAMHRCAGREEPPDTVAH